MNQSDSSHFWNNPQVIQDFAVAEAPVYWKEFFAGYAPPAPNTAYRVLDIGCGAGRNVEMLWRYGYQVDACDLHIGMVEATRKRLEHCVLSEKVAYPLPCIKLADMCSLPYEDSSFHFVIANGVYHNVSSIEVFKQALYETARVMIKDGILCINVFTGRSIDSSSLKPCTSRHIYRTNEGTAMILLPPDELLSLLEGIGFSSQQSVIEYERELNTGRRSVLRSVFKISK